MKNLLTYLILFIVAVGCGEEVVFTEHERIDENRYGLSSDSLIQELSTMKVDTLDCNATTYWKIIQQGDVYIPLLIESLTDTTPTNISNHCKSGKLNIAEVCYFALEEITEFPAFIVTQIQFDVITNDCWNFYEYLYDNENKPKYKMMVTQFYKQNRKSYSYKKYKESDKTKCHKLYSIEGKYYYNN